jgi:regulator of cell morphogenesis and NO signaling
MTAVRTTPTIDPTLSVNEILRRFPSAVGALNAFGIDTCCGGAAPLETAAADAGVPLAEVVAAITAATVAPGGAA